MKKSSLFTPGRISLRGVLKALLYILRVALFYALLWARVPVSLLLQAVTSLAAVAFFIMLVVRGWSNAFEVFWGSMPFCVELDNIKDTDAPIHQPAAMLVAAD